MDGELERAVLEDLATAVESWTTHARDALTNPDADLDWLYHAAAYRRVQQALSGVNPDDLNTVLFDLLSGLMHSTMAVFDGASASAEIARVYIVDEDGEPFEGAMHERYVEHLFDTGRAE